MVSGRPENHDVIRLVILIVQLFREKENNGYKIGK